MRARLLPVALVATLAVLLGLVATASAGSAPPTRAIKLPGGKVQCVLAGGTGNQGGALCIATLNSGVKPFPKKNCNGTGDTGGGLGMTARGRATGICLSENPFQPPVKVLAYGTLIRLGNVSCAAVSRAVGMRCKNAGGHGWTMSPTGWTRF